MCEECGDTKEDFDELKGVTCIERDERYPIRVTLQYYKSTDNGVVNAEIIDAIAKLLKSSQKKAEFVGSLVSEGDSGRTTEWVMQPVEIKEEKKKPVEPEMLES